MPPSGDVSSPVAATGVDGQIPAVRLWSWLTNEYPLRGAVMKFYADTLPPQKREAMEKDLGSTMTGLMDLRAPGSIHGND